MGTIERKGSKDLAKSSTFVVDQSYLGQAPKFFVEYLGRSGVIDRLLESLSFWSLLFYTFPYISLGCLSGQHNGMDTMSDGPRHIVGSASLAKMAL